MKARHYITTPNVSNWTWCGRPYIGWAGQIFATSRPADVTCKRCLAAIKRGAPS